jgi:hypothetical protein
VGDERAETYLRLRAEAELRRVSTELRRADAAAAHAPPDPQTMPFGTAEMAYWNVLRAGRILVAAGVLDQDHLDRIADEMQVAIKVRSRLLLDWDRKRGLPRLARRYQWDWTPGLSWWLRDSAGNWHLATADDPRASESGMRAYSLDDGMQVLWLRLTPPLSQPLASAPGTAEIIVTGTAAQARGAVPVQPAGS